MWWRRDESEEAQFRRAELRRFSRAHRRRSVDMFLGGLLIVAIVAVIFWLIGMSPPPVHEPESANDARPQLLSAPPALSAGARTPACSVSSASSASSAISA